MSFLSRVISTAAIVLAFHSSAFAQPAPAPGATVDAAKAALLEWPVTSAPARYIVEPYRTGPPPPVSLVSICFSNPHWLNATVAFYTDKGVAVGSQLISAVPGEPAVFLFDSSSNANHYDVYVGSGNWPPNHLADSHSGVWLETREGDGQIIQNLPDMLAAWNKSTKVVGKAVVSSIDEGGNRFGPERPLFLHFQGYFDAKTPEHLDFAIVSTDSSFALVDGKEVINWTGHHGWGYDGMKGPPQGSTDVAAGPHVIDYYNAYMSPNNDPPLMACLVVKGGPFDKFTMLVPNNPFFRPVGHAHVTGYEVRGGASTVPGGVPLISITWTNEEQSYMTSDVPDLSLVALQFECFLPSPLNTVEWTFDDGSTATGAKVKHLFPRPGLRTVKVTVKNGNDPFASLTQPVNVHLDWPYPGKGPDLRQDHRADLLSRDPATMTGPDLSCCFAIYGFYGDKDALLKILPALIAKMKDVPDADLPYLKTAVDFLLHEDKEDIAVEMQLVQALVDRGATIVRPSLQIANAIAETRLILAQMTLVMTDHLDEVVATIKSIDPASINGDEQNELKILQADLALASGDLDGAKKQYDALSKQASGLDERSLVRRTAIIGQARAYTDTKDYMGAQDSLNVVSWQTPADRIAPDWALAQIRLYQAEGRPVAAYLYAKRLLPVMSSEGRSEFLYLLTDLAYAQKDDALAAKTLSELLQKHPYSEQAALAKQKWPGKP